MLNIRRFHPGVYLKDSLEVSKMSISEFSFKTGISEETLSSIIDGRKDVTSDIAYSLANYFGASIDYWINLQNQYDLYLKNTIEIKSNIV